MKNKFRIGEIVIVKGIGKIFQSQYYGLGIVIMKDYYYNEYLINMLSNGVEDWFKESEIEIVMDRKFKKKDKYKVALAVDKEGLIYIENKINMMPNKHNNILKKVDFYREYKINKKIYSILIWTSTYWSNNNFVVRGIQESFKILRERNIAYKQIIIGETDPTFIKINEFIDNDANVDIFNIFQKIEIKNIGGILA
ncbi:MAG: hypothetical protein ACLTBX_04890 [Clostridia bacterium]